MAKEFAFQHPNDAIAAVAQQLQPANQQVSLTDAIDRVLAKPICADRDSPAADVSAMDGYAIRLGLLADRGDIPVRGECVPGAPPPSMPEDGVLRIFTGAVVPAGCDAVVKREETVESTESIVWQETALTTTSGANIRRAGENTRRGDVVLDQGCRITAADCAALASFGQTEIPVFAPVPVSILTTGNEVLTADANPEPWQLRNSNRAAIEALLGLHRWIDRPIHEHVRDDRASLTAALHEQLSRSQAVILTGGVSMGDYDYVPDVIEDVGGTIVFHRLPLRPGKPILAATTADGKLILGLPGNPVSATIGCQRFAIPLLARLSGQLSWSPRQPRVWIENATTDTLPLFWLRPVSIRVTGDAELIESKGSGDLVALTKSSGFVEIPPGASGPGPWAYYSWR